LYVVRGEVEVNGVPVKSRTMVELERHAGTDLDIASWDDGALVLLCHGEVIDEPVVAHGPFVMNTEEEIREAYLEYQSGKFGRVGD
ncbi:MAG: pirin-like C-terminal cupin domain-containing protein, partial [Flavobacteriales bacterium]